MLIICFHFTHSALPLFPLLHLHKYTTSSTTMTFFLIAYATKDNVVNVDIFPSLKMTAIFVLMRALIPISYAACHNINNVKRGHSRTEIKASRNLKNHREIKINLRNKSKIPRHHRNRLPIFAVTRNGALEIIFFTSSLHKLQVHDQIHNHHSYRQLKIYRTKIPFHYPFSSPF